MASDRVVEFPVLILSLTVDSEKVQIHSLLCEALETDLTASERLQFEKYLGLVSGVIGGAFVRSLEQSQALND